jgi:predicted nucleic acid-binding protein
LLLHGCQWAARALSTGGQPSDLLTGHKRDQRFDESGPTNRELDGWAEPGRPSGYLYYHSRRSALRYCPLPAGKRRTELEETGRQFLAVFHCEPVPERAGDLYAAVKLARQQRGLSLDENDLWVAATALALGATLVSRDNDFKSIDGLPIVALA